MNVLFNWEFKSITKHKNTHSVLDDSCKTNSSFLPLFY